MKIITKHGEELTVIKETTRIDPYDIAVWHVYYCYFTRGSSFNVKYYRYIPVQDVVAIIDNKGDRFERVGK